LPLETPYSVFKVLFWVLDISPQDLMSLRAKRSNLNVARYCPGDCGARSERKRGVVPIYRDSSYDTDYCLLLDINKLVVYKVFH